MIVVCDGVWLCPDCLIVAVNDDESGIDEAKLVDQIRQGLKALGPNLVPSFDSESGDGMKQCHGQCDCCKRSFWSEWHEFSLLGQEPTFQDVEAFLTRQAGQLRVSHTRGMWNVRLYREGSEVRVSSHEHLAQAVHDMIS